MGSSSTEVVGVVKRESYTDHMKIPKRFDEGNLKKWKCSLSIFPSENVPVSVAHAGRGTGAILVT
jgi:hypothetical protein